MAALALSLSLSAEAASPGQSSRDGLGGGGVGGVGGGEEERVSRQRFAETSRRELELQLRAADRARAKRALVEVQGASLRTKVLEALGRADKWRGESQDAWAARCCDLAWRTAAELEAVGGAGGEGPGQPAARLTPPPRPRPPPPRRGGGGLEDSHELLDARGGDGEESEAAAEAEAESESESEEALEEEIERLREENRALTAEVARSCIRRGGGGALGEPRVAAAPAARRRFLENARQARSHEASNRELRRRLQRRERYRGQLEAALLGQGQGGRLEGKENELGTAASRSCEVRAKVRRYRARSECALGPPTPWGEEDTFRLALRAGMN